MTISSLMEINSKCNLLVCRLILGHETREMHLNTVGNDNLATHACV